MLIFSCLQSIESVIFSAIVISLTATHLSKRAVNTDNSSKVIVLISAVKLTNYSFPWTPICGGVLLTFVWIHIYQFVFDPQLHTQPHKDPSGKKSKEVNLNKKKSPKKSPVQVCNLKSMTCNLIEITVPIIGC